MGHPEGRSVHNRFEGRFVEELRHPEHHQFCCCRRPDRIWTPCLARPRSLHYASLFYPRNRSNLVSHPGHDEHPEHLFWKLRHA